MDGNHIHRMHVYDCLINLCTVCTDDIYEIKLFFIKLMCCIIIMNTTVNTGGLCLLSTFHKCFCSLLCVNGYNIIYYSTHHNVCMGCLLWSSSGG